MVVPKSIPTRNVGSDLLFPFNRFEGDEIAGGCPIASLLELLDVASSASFSAVVSSCRRFKFFCRIDSLAVEGIIVRGEGTSRRAKWRGMSVYEPAQADSKVLEGLNHSHSRRLR